jgi:hypothetical protein
MFRIARHSGIVVSSALFLLQLICGVAYPQEVFFGNLHSHTSYSGGSGTPAPESIPAVQACARGCDSRDIVELPD